MIIYIYQDINHTCIKIHTVSWQYDIVSPLSTTGDIDGLVQERRNSSANALELRLSCTNPSISLSCTLAIHIEVH